LKLVGCPIEGIDYIALRICDDDSTGSAITRNLDCLGEKIAIDGAFRAPFLASNKPLHEVTSGKLVAENRTKISRLDIKKAFA